VVFSENAKGAGFNDVIGKNTLPEDHITVPITGTVIPGHYHATLHLAFHDNPNLIIDYPFTFDVIPGVRILEQPQSSIEICGEDRFMLSVNAVGKDLSYQWYRNGSSIEGADEPELTGMEDGIYYVIVSGECGSVKSSESNVTVRSFKIRIKWDDVLFVLDTENQYVSYQWYKDGSPISEYGKSVYYTDANGLTGSYFVRAYRADGTYDESCPMEFMQLERSGKISVYPNPIERNSVMTVLIPTDEDPENIQIEIFNFAGRSVYKGTAKGYETNIPMGMVPGNYIVKITDESKRVTVQKIIIK